MTLHLDPVPPPTSVVVRPFSREEVGAFRGAARRDDGFAALLERAVRLQILAGLGRSRLDPEARVGVDKAEAAALLDLAQHPSRDHHQWRLKSSMFRHVGTHRGNLHGMLSAALTEDAARLGIPRSRTSPAARERDDE